MKKKINKVWFTYLGVISLVTATIINLAIAKQDYRLASLNVSNYYTAQAIGRLPDASDQVRELYRSNRDSLSSYKATDSERIIFRKLKRIEYSLAPSNSK